MKPLLLKYDLGQKIKEYGTWELAATPQICHWKQEKKKKKGRRRRKGKEGHIQFMKPNESRGH